MAPPRLLLGLAALTIACQEKPPAPTTSGPELGSVACKECHQKIVESFVQTAHFKTSAPASEEAIKGHFADGRNILRTKVPDTYFKMENVGGVFYQTGSEGAQHKSRTERFDLVVGSGRVGQSYLYWKNGAILQLPVSYLTGVDGWIDSPGYPDGRVDFDRVIPPRCLECHSTYFRASNDRGTPKYGGDYMLGISCAKCHGPLRAHVDYQVSHRTERSGKYVLNPARFSRERKLDNCALCHSGGRQPNAPPFSYLPGEKLDDFLVPGPQQADSVPDVHGNQVGLLARSKCFRSSLNMSCSTCHDVHRVQRDVTQLASKCLACHETSKHKMAERIGNRMMIDCVDCHMPNQRYRLIRINTPTGQFSPELRSHLIGIYPEVATTVLQASRR
jgi:hypothetical protein